MLKRPDIGTRKKLRIAMCVFYVLQLFVCTLPFLQFVNEKNVIEGTASPYYLVLTLFRSSVQLPEEVVRLCVVSLFLFIIPLFGFLFCAFDKERNLKNIVSAICCLAAVYLILVMTSAAESVLSIGAIVAMLLYIVIMLLTSMAFVMRFSKDPEKGSK